MCRFKRKKEVGEEREKAAEQPGLVRQSQHVCVCLCVSAPGRNISERNLENRSTTGWYESGLSLVWVWFESGLSLV